METYTQDLKRIKNNIVQRNDKIKIYGLVTGNILRIIDLINVDVSSLKILDIMGKDCRSLTKRDLIRYIYILQQNMRMIDLRCLVRQELYDIIFDIMNDQGRV